MVIPGFTLTQLLNEGTHTFVYRAIRDINQEKVIIKILNTPYTAEEFAHFRREYQLQESLQGVGTIKVYSFEMVENTAMIIMEDDNRSVTLKQFLADKPHGISLPEFFQIAIKVTEALEIIHNHHIIHKDINPPNILWDEVHQTAKIIDFGLSSLLLKENLEVQSLQKLEGTLDYISPEQTGRMNRAIDYRSDFYSLGATFYELLTGRHLFEENDILKLVHCHIATTPVPVSEINPNVPEAVSNIISKLLAKVPEERYSSAAGIREDLLKCQQQLAQIGEIEQFELGLKDTHDQLILSQKLYGREEEVMQLLSLFEQVSQGSKVFLLIGGYSGIGKTTVVNEIYKPITKQSAYFVSGKYDQLKRSIPYSGIIESLQALVRYLLTEPESSFASLKEELLKELGNNGRVITDVIPEIELIIGPQPRVTELTPSAEQSRFLNTFICFMRAFAKKEHPLVIFLDDLQWADSASLKLIQALLTDNQLTYFFLIGAFRDNEVKNNHPLLFMKDQLKKAEVMVYNMLLKPLRVRDVHNLLADSLNMKRSEIAPFADLVLSKTHGNPFFINEFLRKLYHDKLLFYSYQEYKWQWDIAKIQEEAITDNVINLLISRIHRLPEATQKILEYAACIGHVFDLETLCIISQRPVQEVSEALSYAMQTSFISPANQNYQLAEISIDIYPLMFDTKIEYRFQHDRVQQAAYQLINDNERQQLHLRIGRLLLKNKKPTKDDEKLFELVDHFNHSLILITHPEEKFELAEYNLWAGKKAKGSAAFDAAINYLEAGLSLISDIPVSAKQKIYFELCKELATCHYITGDFEKAESGYALLLKEVKETQTLMEVYKLQCQMLCTQNKHHAAIQLGLKALADLNFKISSHPRPLAIIWAMIKIEFLFWRKPNLLNSMLPLMTSKRYKSISDILGQLMISSLVVNRRLFILLTMTNAYISLTNGYTKNTTSVGLSYTIILRRIFNSHTRIMKLADYFCKQEDHYGMAISKSRVLALLSITIDPWRYNLDKCYDEIYQTLQYANEESDFFIASLCYLTMYLNAFMIGKPILEIMTIIEDAQLYFEKNKVFEFLGMSKILHSLFVNYMEESPNLSEKFMEAETKLIKGEQQTRTPVAASVIFSEISKFCYLLGYFEEAQKWALKSLRYKININGLFAVSLAFFNGLGILAGKNPKNYIHHLKSLHRNLQRFAKWSPENFNFYLVLFEAEYASMMGKVEKAMRLYNHAINIATEQKFLLNIGIVNECTARFYEKLNITDAAKTFYMKAHHAYQHWGAAAVVKRIEKMHPNWFKGKSLSIMDEKSTLSIDSQVSSLDVLSLLRATQVISSEIQLDVLLKKLIVILLQNAGAQRGALITKDDNDSWFITVEGTIAAQHVSLTKDIDIEDRNDLPLSLIRFVQRTQEMIIAQNKVDFEAFQEDLYLKEVRPQSVVILPLLHLGQMNAMIFMENRDMSNAFTTEHIHTLKLLSSQAVISLENARLFYQATHDPLTGLANRNSLYQMFPFAMGRAKRNNSSIAVLFIDLDGFKKINDLLGHDIGDKFLIQVAERIKTCLRDGDLAVRLGGDEFVALLEDADFTQVKRVAERLLYKTEPVVIQGNTIPVLMSIGISLYPDHADDIDTLLKQADIALYHVKESGKGHYQFYSQNLDEQLKQENQLEMELQGATERGELCIYYQPVYTANQHKLTHFEALLRWRHPSLGLLEPKSFIHFAESNDLILTLGAWIFNKVFNQIKTWQNAGLQAVPVAINVSSLQLKKEMLSVYLPKLLNELSLDPHIVELELTESIFIDFDTKISENIQKLKNLGIRFTLDDFGSHYSSLSYLSRFPVDYIKIDQSFIKNIENESKDCELIITIINMAHNLDLRVIAEGVETKNQMLFLEENHIDELQGYYLSRPMSHENAEKLLEKLPIDADLG